MTPLSKSLIDAWRVNYNPLRGLTLGRAVGLLEAGERGEYPDLQWAYRTIEKRDGILRACRRRISSALVELDWEIKIPETVPAGAKAQARRQHDTLREAYDNIENLREAFQCLSGADFRGYTHLEKVYDHSRLGGKGPWKVKRLELVPQWHWVRDGLYGDWKFVEDARQTSGRYDGTPIQPDHFIIREVSDPINEIALIAFIRKNLGQKDWDAFVESYGIPWFFLELPEGVKPGTTEAQAYMDFVQMAMSDARGAIPNGSKPHSLQVNAQNQPFDEYLKRQDNEIVLAATSSLLTVTTEAGSGTLAGGAHQDTFEAVARAQAMLISEIFNDQFDRPLLNALFPGQPVYAYFELAAQDEEDVKDVVENVSKLKTAGYAMDLADLEERTGYKLEKSEPLSLTPQQSGLPAGPPARKGSDPSSSVTGELAGNLPNREGLLTRILNRLLNRDPQAEVETVPSASLDEAMRKEYQDLYAELDRISKLKVEERQDALQAFRDSLPDALRSILSSTASIDVIEEALAESIIGGAIDSAKFGRERPITERKLS